MERVENPPVNPRFLTILGLVGVLGFVAGLFFLMATRSYSSWSAFLIAPLLIALTVPAIIRETKRQADRLLFWLLLAAVVAKLVGSVARYIVAFSVYEGVSDATSYHEAGAELSEKFRAGNFDHGLHPLTNTNFIKFFTGIVYTLIGPTRLGGFLFYSWLGFWGVFFFYRAFVIAVPEGRARTYAKFVFFLPSLVFWPSSIGKDAWMLFCLGIASFGVARILTGSSFRGLVFTVIGLSLGSLVRPHLTGIVALGLATAFVMRKPKEELRQLGPLAKAFLLLIIGGLAIFMVVKADNYLKGSPLTRDGSDVDSMVSRNTELTSQGGSEFSASVVRSPARFPIAAVTILFRPFLFEVHNFQALIAALESTALLGIALVRWRWGITALTSVRRQPYVVYALVTLVLFIIGFSTVGNFGILTRQRSQIWPLFLVFISTPPKDVRDAKQSELVETATS